MRDWVLVVPAPGALKETIRALLDLAHTPGDVRTQGTGQELLVPPYLAELYTAPPAPKRRRVKKEEGEE